MAFESKQSVSESVSESVSKVGIELLGQLKKLYTLNVVQALKLIYVFKFSVSFLLLDSISFLCMFFSVNFLRMIFSIFMIDFKIPFGLSEFHQFNAPTQLNDQTFQTISLFFFYNKTKWNKSNIYQRSTDFA